MCFDKYLLLQSVERLQDSFSEFFLGLELLSMLSNKCKNNRKSIIDKLIIFLLDFHIEYSRKRSMLKEGYIKTRLFLANTCGYNCNNSNM